MPVQIEGPLPEPGASIMFGDKNVGEMRSGNKKWGLALIRLDCYKEISESGDSLSSESTALRPVKPDWAEFSFKP